MSGYSDSTQDTSEKHQPIWRNRNFLRFFMGQFVTNAGDSLYSVATLWLVFELSESTFLTGLASSMLLLPYLLQIIAGPIIDRFPIKPILVGTQLVQGVILLVLPLASYTGNLTVGLLFLTIPTLSLFALLMFPIPSTLLPRIVADEQLSKGNSALSTITLGLDMIFDAFGGLFIAVFGATALLVLDSFTFVVAGVLFLGMTIPRVRGGGDRDKAQSDETTLQTVLQAYVADLRIGIDILRGSVFIELMATAAIFNFAVGITLAILPSFGESLGGPAFYGFMLGALGVGRLVGSVVAAGLDDVPYGWLVTVSYLCSACLWVGSIYVTSPFLTVVLFGLAWVSPGINGVLTSTLNQTVFPTDLLGRIASIKGTASTATLPLGSLIGGGVAELLGTTTTMGLAGLGFGVVGLYFALRPRLRQIPAISEADSETFDLDFVSDES
ncbi:MFS transporter [Halovenus rubra]|uniref:MFS transporter n=2 Tax=Halovenus rubra TaxID=869890 RepID=A0ACC7DYI8_9EURY|nr:MFS transporter [Halovenus rubra]